mgnify:CR=1 FL=1
MKLGQKLSIGWIRVQLKTLSAVSAEAAGNKAFDLFCTPFYRSQTPQPEIFRQADRLELLTGGKKVFGHRWNASAEKTILIVHGFESTSYNFEKYISPLLERGFGVMAFDAPAHGSSEGKRINAIDYCRVIASISERYGPIYGVVAHSFGGLATALWAETAEPGPEKLALIAPATETSTAVDAFSRFLNLTPPVKRAFEHRIKELSGHDVSWFSVPRTLEAHPKKVLWVHDQDDDVTPFSDARRFMERRPENVTFMVTSGLGHRRIYREQSVIDAVVAYF